MNIDEDLLVQVLVRRDLVGAGHLYDLPAERILANLAIAVAEMQKLLKSSPHAFVGDSNLQYLIDICLNNIIRAMDELQDYDSFFLLIHQLLQTIINILADDGRLIFDDSPFLLISEDIYFKFFSIFAAPSTPPSTVHSFIPLLLRYISVLDGKAIHLCQHLLLFPDSILLQHVDDIVNYIVQGCGHSVLLRLLYKVSCNKAHLLSQPYDAKLISLLIPSSPGISDVIDRFNIGDLRLLLCIVEKLLNAINCEYVFNHSLNYLTRNPYTSCLAELLSIFIAIARLRPFLFADNLRAIFLVVSSNQSYNARSSTCGGDQQHIASNETIMLRATMLAVAVAVVDRSCGEICSEWLLDRLTLVDLSLQSQILEALVSIYANRPSLLQQHLNHLNSLQDNLTSTSAKKILSALLNDAESFSADSSSSNHVGSSHQALVVRGVATRFMRDSDIQQPNLIRHPHASNIDSSTLLLPFIATDPQTSQNQHFHIIHGVDICEFVRSIANRLPSPLSCDVIVSPAPKLLFVKKPRRAFLRLFFICERGRDRCASQQSVVHVYKQRHVQIWLRLMFLRQKPSNIQDILTQYASFSNTSFATDASSFPTLDEIDSLWPDLLRDGFLDHFEWRQFGPNIGEVETSTTGAESSNDEFGDCWSCFVCARPDLLLFLQEAGGGVAIQGAVHVRKAYSRRNFAIFRSFGGLFLTRWRSRLLLIERDCIILIKPNQQREILPMSIVRDCFVCRRGKEQQRDSLSTNSFILRTLSKDLYQLRVSRSTNGGSSGEAAASVDAIAFVRCITIARSLVVASRQHSFVQITN